MKEEEGKKLSEQEIAEMEAKQLEFYKSKTALLQAQLGYETLKADVAYQKLRYAEAIQKTANIYVSAKRVKDSENEKQTKEPGKK